MLVVAVVLVMMRGALFLQRRHQVRACLTVAPSSGVVGVLLYFMVTG